MCKFEKVVISVVAAPGDPLPISFTPREPHLKDVKVANFEQVDLAAWAAFLSRMCHHVPLDRCDFVTKAQAACEQYLTRFTDINADELRPWYTIAPDVPTRSLFIIFTVPQTLVVQFESQVRPITVPLTFGLFKP